MRGGGQAAVRSAPWSVAALALLLAPSPATAQLGGSTMARGLIASVPFEFVGNRILIQVTVDSSGPLTYVFDTGGAGGPLLNARTARRLGIGGSDTLQGVGFSGQAPVVRSRGHTVRVGPLRFDDMGVGLLDMDHIERAEGRPIDGIIGGPLLSRYAVRIDFDSARLEFYDNRRFTYEPGGRRLDVEVISGSVAVLDATATFDEGSRFAGRLILDSGSPGTALFNARFAARTGILDRVTSLCETAAAGASSRTVPVRWVMPQDFAFGGFRTGTIPAAVAVPQPQERFRPQSDGTMGLDVLGRFNVLIDIRHRRVFLEPNGVRSEPLGPPCSGVSLATDTTFQRILVDRVYEGSPAREAGLEPGDEIVSVGGRAASDLTIQGVRRMLRGEWTEMEMFVSRRGEARTVVLRRTE